MKKVNLLCLAALAALTLTNCSQDELSSPITAQSQNAIGFDSYFGRNAQGVSSRGSVQNIASVASSGFGVYAYQSTDTYSSGTGSFNPNLMSNVQVTGTGSGTYTWTYSPTRYWPVSDYVSFLAYAPYASSGYSLVNSSSQESGDRIYLKGFEVNSTITSQVDLLWNTNNVLNKQKPTDGAKVQMKFAHALSRIGVNVSSSQASSDTKITITSITLSGKDKDTETTKTGAFSKSGLLKLTSTDATDLWASISTDNKLAFTYESSNLSATELKNSSTTITNKDDSYLMVIPQDFTYEASGTPSLYLTVTYTVQTGDEATVTNTVSAPISQKFEASKAYTLKINVGLTPIEFDVETTIAGWDSTSDVNVTI